MPVLCKDAISRSGSKTVVILRDATQRQNGETEFCLSLAQRGSNK